MRLGAVASACEEGTQYLGKSNAAVRLRKAVLASLR